MKNKSNKNYSVQEDVINIQFTEIFELEDIQRLQDLFSDTQGIASVITDPDSKPITKPSKVCRLLQDLIRITEPKLAASFNIIRDKNNQTYLASEKRAGLLPDVLKSSVKIIVDNKHIANWTIVQMRSEGLNENQKINFCKEIGLNREDFSKALEEVPPMTVNQFDKVIRMLVEFSGEFSKNASSKLRIKKHIAELQHVNELLKEERQIFSQGNVVIFKWKNQENWPVEYVSPNVGQVFGYAPDEIQSPKFDFASLIHPEDLDRVSSEVSLNSSQHKECFEHAPYRIISKNGKIHWISDYTIIQRNNERQIVSYIGYIIDITDRKETEETLRENENKFRTVADFTYDWEYWEDSKKKIIYISPSCKRITGYEPEEFLSDNMLLKKIVHPGDLEFLEGHFEKVHSVEHIHEIEELDFRIIKKDGSEAYVGHLCRPVFNDQGKYLGRRVSNREITDRKLAEETLRASEENLRITLQSVADAVIVTDREGRVTRMNKVAESLTGWSIEEALNKPFCEIFYIINDDTLHIIANPVDIALKTGKTSGMANHAVFINRNKIEYQISESAAPIVDGNGNIKGVIFVFSDITEKYYAQKVIAESERNYREIFNSSTDAIFIHHKTTGAIIDINETMLRMYGYDDKSEIINLNPGRLSATEEGYSDEKVLEMLGLTRHSASKTFEWRAKKKTGEIFSVEVTLHRTQICGEERIMASVRDTTERKILENSIQTQFRFKNALNEILAVIISSDNCKTILSKTTNILGEILQVDRCLIYEVDIDKNLLAALTEWLNPNYSDISPTKGDYPIDLFKSGIAEMQRSGQYQVSHFDEINPVLLLDESDKLLHGAMNIKSALWYPFSFSARGYYLLVLNDTHKKRTWTNDEIDFLHAVSKHVCIALEKNRLLDEKKITDDLLIEQSHILRRVVDNSPCGIWMINVAGKMKFVNKTYCDLVGIPEANFLAVHHYAELYDEVTAGKCMKSDKETLELNKPYTFHESVKFVDGKYHDLEIVKSRITDEHCNPLGLIGISLDITERKQTQDELEERKEKYRGLSEASYEAIFLSENGVCIEQNQTAEKMFGYTSSEAIGRYGTEWISPEDREMVMNNMLIGFEDPYEVTAMKKDGTTFPCLLRGKMMNYKGKNVRVTSLSDITERKRAEKAEHESELRYRSLFKTSPSGIMIMDEHGIILEANKAISNSTHYSPDELVGFDIRRLSPQEQEHMVDENIQRILGGEHLEQEVLCKRKDGSICSFLLNEIAIILPSGRPGILSVSNDISERKNLELEKDRNLLVQEALNDLLHLSVDNLSLEESLEKVLTTILSLSFLSLENKGGIFLVDENQSELKLTTTSNLGAEIKLMCARVPFGKCLCGCAAANRQMLFSPCIDERHENRYAGIQPHGHFNVPILGPDNVLGVMVIYLAEHHKQKKIETDFLLAAADILSGLIQRKKNEEAIKNALVKAESANRLKTAFINNISHEVRTPLNGLLGFANLIVQPDVTEDEKIQYSSIMTSSSNRLMNTITSYIDISLISSASMVVKRDSFDLNQLMHQLYLQVQPLCDTKNLILHLETPEKTDGIKFFTDPELLHKILWHLLDNSIKFTDIGNINFGYEIQSGLYRFYIKDTGIGINKESLSQIFESFKKEELSLTRTYEGSGLGLTIVQELLQLLGSEVHVESEKGIGSTFFFFLPLEEISGALNSEKVIIDLPFQKPIILIVEDDTANRLYLETISRKYADMILLATNGKEAVDLCLTHPEISLVLMDIRMPVMDGLEATRVIKSSRKNLPIFAITAFANIGDEKKAVEAGCDEYLSKPLSREALLVKLKQHGMLK